MNKSPAFQFYAADFLADENVVAMSLEERGAYITLICFCWREGSIPSDVNRLARLCGVDGSAMAQLWPSLCPAFSQSETEPSRMVHPRLEKERLKQLDRKVERSESGKRGAEKRWTAQQAIENKGNAQSKPKPEKAIGSAIAKPMANDSSSSSSSSSTSNKSESTNVDSDKPTKPPKDERSNHWAVASIRSLIGYYPKKILWDEIIVALGDEPQVERLAECYKAWSRVSGNASNSTWYLDWFVNGIPANRNGTQARSPNNWQQSKTAGNEAEAAEAIRRMEERLKNASGTNETFHQIADNVS